MTSRGICSRGMPSNRIAPSHGSYRPQTSLATVDLPLPEPPDQGDAAPGPDLAG